MQLTWKDGWNQRILTLSFKELLKQICGLSKYFSIYLIVDSWLIDWSSHLYWILEPEQNPVFSLLHLQSDSVFSLPGVTTVSLPVTSLPYVSRTPASCCSRSCSPWTSSPDSNCRATTSDRDQGHKHKSVWVKGLVRYDLQSLKLKEGLTEKKVILTFLLVSKEPKECEVSCLCWYFLTIMFFVCVHNKHKTIIS